LERYKLNLILFFVMAGLDPAIHLSAQIDEPAGQARG
jgi:hypothetical protein